jgi:heme-degrading monooxygenase HmoA
MCAPFLSALFFSFLPHSAAPVGSSDIPAAEGPAHLTLNLIEGFETQFQCPSGNRQIGRLGWTSHNRLRKEGIMTVRILIKRRFKEGYFGEIEKMIKMVRHGAMNQAGYISSETMWDHEDPFRVVIASTWRDKPSWDKWKNSPERQTKEREFESFLDGQTEYELFDLGMYPH